MNEDIDKTAHALHQPVLSHVHELYCFSKLRRSPLERLRASGPAQIILSALLLVWRGFEGIVRDVLLSPSTLVLDPVQSLLVVGGYPLLGAAVLLLSLAFALGSIGGYGDSLIDWISDTWAKSYSIVNWPNPDVFDDLAESVENAQEYLDGSNATTQRTLRPLDENAAHREPVIVRTFSLPLARTFLAVSALVYERKDALVRQAREVATTAYEVFGEGSGAFVKQLEGAAQMLVLSESTIREQAEKWSLAFEGVSDLNSVAGAFAGLFYSQPGSTSPFIVLSFKGTGPTAFAEWLTDCTLDRTSATSIYGGGGAHTGFFRSLFKSAGRDCEGTGYETIVRAIQQVAAALKDAAVEVTGNQDLQVQLWVTGHSLGGALAELTFMRFLVSPLDLGADVSLRDCYTFGAPRPGDGTLSGRFDAALLSPLDRPNVLWRVKNGLDVVPRVPLGSADDEDQRDALGPLHVLNYAHVGPAVRTAPLKAMILGRRELVVEYLGRLKGTTKVRFIESGGVTVPWRTAASDSVPLLPGAPAPIPAAPQPPFPGTFSLLRSSLTALYTRADSALYTFVAARGTNPVQWACTAAAVLVPGVWEHFPAAYQAALAPPSAPGGSQPRPIGDQPPTLRRTASAPPSMDIRGRAARDGPMAAMVGPGTGSSGGFGLGGGGGVAEVGDEGEKGEGEGEVKEEEEEGAETGEKTPEGGWQ